MLTQKDMNILIGLVRRRIRQEETRLKKRQDNTEFVKSQVDRINELLDIEDKLQEILDGKSEHFVA